MVDGLKLEQITWFGSHAYSEPNARSYIDLTVIVSKSSESGHMRPQEARKFLKGIGIPRDIVVMTQEEVTQKATVPGSLTSIVLQKGKTLYG